MKIKLDTGAFMPEYAHKQDAGMDLRSPVNAVVLPQDSAIIHTACTAEKHGTKNVEHPRTDSERGGDGDAGGDEMSRYDVLFMNGKSLMFWALEWFSMSNDAFFACYGFNFNPHHYPGLYEQAGARYFSKEAKP